MHPTSSSLGGPLISGPKSSAPSANDAHSRDARKPDAGSFRDSMKEASRPHKSDRKSADEIHSANRNERSGKEDAAAAKPASRSAENPGEASSSPDSGPGAPASGPATPGGDGAIESSPASGSDIDGLDEALEPVDLVDSIVPESAGILTVAHPEILMSPLSVSLTGSAPGTTSPTSLQSVLNLQESAGKSGLLTAAIESVAVTADADGESAVDPTKMKTFGVAALDPGLNPVMTERTRLSGLPVQLQMQLENTGLAAEVAPQPLLDSEFGKLFARNTSAASLGNPSLSDVTTGATVPDSLRTAVPVSVTFGHEKWQQLAAERTVSLLQQGVQSAELMLDPPELGPLQVRIQIQNEQAVVQFTSANAAVREALDQTIPRLREMLQEQGMSLLHAGVSDQSSGQSSSGEHAEGGETGGDAAAPVATVAQPDAPQAITLKSGIDDFA